MATPIDLPEAIMAEEVVLHGYSAKNILPGFINHQVPEEVPTERTNIY